MKIRDEVLEIKWTRSHGNFTVVEFNNFPEDKEPGYEPEFSISALEEFLASEFEYYHYPEHEGAGTSFVVHAETGEFIGAYGTRNDAQAAISMARKAALAMNQGLISKLDQYKKLTGILADKVGPTEYGQAVAKAGIKANYTPLRST